MKTTIELKEGFITFGFLHNGEACTREYKLTNDTEIDMIEVRELAYAAQRTFVFYKDPDAYKAKYNLLK